MATSLLPKPLFSATAAATTTAPRHLTLTVKATATTTTPPKLSKQHTVKSVKARQIIDSRSNRTVEVDLFTASGDLYRSAVPSGTSTGIYEALELRDGDHGVYGGKGVLRAVHNINDFLGPSLIGLHDLMLGIGRFYHNLLRDRSGSF